MSSVFKGYFALCELIGLRISSTFKNVLFQHWRTICISVHMYIHKCLGIYACKYTSTYIHIYIYTLVLICTYIHVYTSTQIHMYTQVLKYTCIHKYSNTHVYTSTQIHMYTHVPHKLCSLSSTCSKILPIVSFVTSIVRVAFQVELRHEQDCQIFLSTCYQNREKCTKWTQNLPNGFKISQMSVKYSQQP
jgi:hypothetical protein